MIPRLGDGNLILNLVKLLEISCLENDSPSRGRKQGFLEMEEDYSLEFRK